MPGLRSATLLKRRLAQVFPSEFCEFFKNTYFEERSGTTASELFSFPFFEKHRQIKS